jgi:predicted HTH transcriptional regulator
MLNKEDNFDPANTNPYCGQIIIGVNDKERSLIGTHSSKNQKE